MKIAYISHARYPSEKAYGVQMTRVCEALTQLGHTVTLLAPGVHNEIKWPYDEYYDVTSKFSVEHLPTKDALLSRWIPGRFAMLFTMRSYRQALRSHVQQQKYDLLYARSPHVLSTLLQTGMPVVLELHTLPRRGKGFFVRQCNRCALVVCLTTAMKEELVAWGVPAERIIVEGDAVDLNRFKDPEAIIRFALPKKYEAVVGYVGSLTTMDNVEKGVDLLVRAAQHLPNSYFFIVGGPDAHVSEYEELAASLGLSPEQIHFEGHVPFSNVLPAIRSCDVCVYPAPKSSHPYFIRDTSPLKLFEYLAAGVPVVCADIPPVRDIVDETSVWFFEPGDAHSLSEAIKNALSKEKEAQAKAQKGLNIAAYHTWEKRMRRILTAVSAQ